ncbi:hypothetical protein BV898_17595 [Hypsibius exemplaris]|uniref:Uncharacterized protein n=1 Tax=Hypsibius exemplaris TaxID=2072580 RepID=A0A9X6NIB2_HYPEX|nr:hypothetical protein BV898_17595 [Hypsibius exemplaris]
MTMKCLVVVAVITVFLVSTSWAGHDARAAGADQQQALPAGGFSFDLNAPSGNAATTTASSVTSVKTTKGGKANNGTTVSGAPQPLKSHGGH